MDAKNSRSKLKFYRLNDYYRSRLLRIHELFDGLNTNDVQHYVLIYDTAVLNEVNSLEAAQEKKEKERQEKYEALINEFNTWIADNVNFEYLRNLWRNNKDIPKIEYPEKFHKLTRPRLFESPGLRLTPDGEKVQTSMGAYVPFREALILLGRIRKGQDVKGFKIGMYTVISIKGTLKIGCHEITREEIEQFCKVNNL